MKKSTQLIILAVLLVVVIFVWSSLGKARRTTKAAVYEAGIESTKDASGFSFWGKKSLKKRKSSEFKEWGRNPFLLSERVMALSGFNLMGILWDEASPTAIINDTVVGINDSIEGSRVVDIKKDRVILTDGKNTVELRLWEEKER